MHESILTKINKQLSNGKDRIAIPKRNPINICERNEENDHSVCNTVTTVACQIHQ